MFYFIWGKEKDGTMKGQWYWVAGFWPSAFGAMIVFFVAWLYSISLFGMALGLVLGWIPALLVAAFGYYLFRLLWAPLVGMLAMAALVLVGS